MNNTEIVKHRSEIDLLDGRLLELLNRRAELARELGQMKRKAGLSVYDRKRETLILRRLLAHNLGPLEEKALLNIFRCILRESRRLQLKRKRVDLNLKFSSRQNQGVRSHDHQHA